MGKTKSKFDPYEHITTRIIEYFESSERPEWKAPWAGLSVPKNATSGRKYSGVNVLLLWIRMQEEEWTEPLFLTFNQMKTVAAKFPDDECKIRKGSKTEKVCFWNHITRKDDDGEERTFPMLRLYHVFNIAQLETTDKVMSHLKKHVPTIEFEDDRERDEALEEYLSHLNTDVTHGGNRAFYRPSDDSITMPDIKQFVNTDAYYSVRFHEEAHRTGHESRLNRDLKNRFGDDAYAFEEMVAEMSSAFLCSRYNFSSTLQHPEYIKTWCKRMSGDKYAIFRSSTLAKNVLQWMDQQQPNEDKDEVAA